VAIALAAVQGLAALAPAGPGPLACRLGGALGAPRPAAAGGEHGQMLPALTFEDQEGRRLDLAGLRGRVVVVVYGGRSGVDHHVAWGKQIDGDLRAQGVYRLEEDAARRPVQILAVAQMGGIPERFRALLRAVLRPRVERGYSLWLDWDDRMSALFGARDPDSTVVVADREGRVRLVVWGKPEGAARQAVSELLDRLR
jgi:hypothetical protein